MHLAEGRTFIAGFDRPNIHYSIVPKESPQKQILQFIKGTHPRDSGIVYCLSRKMVDETAAWLCAQGFKALPYHAGMEAEDRSRNQERFLREDNTIMVATIAFGMGIDKPDVRFVAHMTVPKNIEAYYQETGRAGRDGLPANALMLYGMQDAAMQRNFIDESNAPESQKRIEHQKLNALLGLCEAASCRRKIVLEYFGDSSGPCGNCDTCLAPPVTFDGTVAAQKAISCSYRTGQRFGVGYMVDVLLGKTDERMERFGHDKISTFGIGAEFGPSEWQSIFRQLVALHLLTPDGSEYGGLKITPRGLAFLQKKESLQLRKFTGKARVEVVGRTKAPVALDNESDQQLFEALRGHAPPARPRAERRALRHLPRPHPARAGHPQTEVPFRSLQHQRRGRKENGTLRRDISKGHFRARHRLSRDRGACRDYSIVKEEWTLRPCAFCR